MCPVTGSRQTPAICPFENMDLETKRIVCQGVTLVLVLASVCIWATQRWLKNARELSPVLVNRVYFGTALAATLTFVLESDGVKSFARAVIDEAYHDSYYHYQLFLIGTLVVWLASMRPAPKSEFLSQVQTEEMKGLMQVWFVMRHYVGARWAQSAGRNFVGCFLFLTGYGLTVSTWKNKKLRLNMQEYGMRMTWIFWRVNFLPLLCMALLDVSYMGYFFIPLATFWSLVTFTLVYGCRCLRLAKRGVTLACVAGLGVCLSWVLFPSVLELCFAPLSFVFALDGNLHEWAFRLALDPFGCLSGALFALHRKKVIRTLQRLERDHPGAHKVSFAAGLALLLGWCFYITLAMTKKEYYQLHPLTSVPVILLLLLLRNYTTGFRSVYSPVYRFLGSISLELYMLQYHMLLCGHATQHLLLIPDSPLLSFVVLCPVFVLACWTTQQASLVLFPLTP